MNALEGEETIFAEVLRLSPHDRAAYLDQSTNGNPALRQRLESLLKSYDAGDFLEQAATSELRRTINIPVPLTGKPGDRIGRYKLLQQIGEGGCGVVYMAEQEEPVRRRVALKIIKLGMDTKSVIARFEAERQALAMMDHPNIAKVLDAGATEAGRPYFVMEIVRGMKITDYCDEAKLSTHARLDLFILVCQAIQHAHQKGIIHRDIKPSNILVTVNDGVPVPKVIDFGIAKATSGQLLTDKTLFTAFEQFIGTPAYMSPEQAVLTSLDIDTRSDIYALGVLLYELLTGKTPFDGKELLAIGLDEMRRTIRDQEPPRPSTRLSTLAQNELSTTAQRRGLDAPKLVSELRGDLDWIVMKALEKDRARRYETANGLAADIQRHLNNEPVAACPPSNFYRFKKMVRRNTLAFAAATTVATALLLGIGLSTWMFVRERAALREQVRLRELAEANERRAEIQSVRNQALASRMDMAFLMRGGYYADVDSVLNKYLARSEFNDPKNAARLEVRGYFFARRGRFHEAAVDYSNLVKFEPESIQHHFRLAPLLLINGDVAGYRNLCDLMLARFGRTRDEPGIADRVAKTCCLLPPSQDQLAEIRRLAELAVTGEETGNVNNNPWYEFGKGLSEYRQGNYDSAINWMQKSLSQRLRHTDDSRFSAACTVIAMAQYRLGRPEEASRAFEEGMKFTQSLPALASSDLGDEWQNPLIAHLLMREATALIERKAEAKAEAK